MVLQDGHKWSISSWDPIEITCVKHSLKQYNTIADPLNEARNQIHQIPFTSNHLGFYTVKYLQNSNRVPIGNSKDAFKLWWHAWCWQTMSKGSKQEQHMINGIWKVMRSYTFWGKLWVLKVDMLSVLICYSLKWASLVSLHILMIGFSFVCQSIRFQCLCEQLLNWPTIKMFASSWLRWSIALSSYLI